MLPIELQRNKFDGLKRWLVSFIITLVVSVPLSTHGSAIDDKILQAGEELFRERLPLKNGACLYNLRGLRPNMWYEVKISYPSSIPSTFSLHLTRGMHDLPLNRGRKLLNTEKLIFKTDGMQSMNDQGEMSVLVNVVPEGIVAIPGKQEQEYVIFNIVCDELLLGISHQAWNVVVYVLFCLVLASAAPSFLPPFLLQRHGKPPALTKET